MKELKNLKTSSPILNSRKGFKLLPEHRERKSDLPDMAVPNEALSIKEILKRFTKGLDLPPSRSQPVYTVEDNAKKSTDPFREVTHDSEDLEKVVNSDLVDQDEYRATVQQRIDDFEKTIERQKKEKAEKLKKQKEGEALKAHPEPSPEKLQHDPQQDQNKNLTKPVK